VSSRTIKPVRIESLLAGVLNVGKWLASIVIAAGLVLSFISRANAISHRRTGSHCRDRVIRSAADLRVILMLTIFVKERDYKFAAAAVVLLIIFAGFAIGILSK